MPTRTDQRDREEHGSQHVTCGTYTCVALIVHFGRETAFSGRWTAHPILIPGSVLMAESEKPEINRNITISGPGITVEVLAEKLGVRPNLVLKKLLDGGIFAMPSQVLDAELASEMANAFGASVRIQSD